MGLEMAPFARPNGACDPAFGPVCRHQTPFVAPLAAWSQSAFAEGWASLQSTPSIRDTCNFLQPNQGKHIMNFTTKTNRAVSFALAVITVVGTLQFIDSLASREHGATVMARAAATVAKVAVQGVTAVSKRG